MDVEITFAGNKKINASVNGFLVKTDQPEKVGGEGQEPTPFELFLAALGTCAGIFVKSFCDQRNLPTEKIKVIEHIERDPLKHSVSKIGIEIQIPDDFPEKYREAVINAAEQCTVKKLIQNPPEFAVYTSIV